MRGRRGILVVTTLPYMARRVGRKGKQSEAMKKGGKDKGEEIRPIMSFEAIWELRRDADTQSFAVFYILFSSFVSV